MMKKIFNPFIIPFFLVFALVFSCEKNPLAENTCDVKNPLKDLVWMKKDIAFIEQLSPDESQYITITMATYNGETVFFSIYCDPAIEAVFPVRDCTGKTIGYWGEIPQEELKDQQVIWRSGNCICL
jgi:hypothetical protein